MAFLKAEKKMQSPSSSHGAVQCSVYRELLLLLSSSRRPQPHAVHMMCVCGCTSGTARMWRSGDNSVKAGLFFHFKMGSGD